MAEYAGDDFDDDDDDHSGVTEGKGVAAGISPDGGICLVVVDEHHSPLSGVTMTADETQSVIEMLEKCLARRGERAGRMN